MALTAAQQAEMDKLKQFLAEQDLMVRQQYPATFATNGKLFFELFQELNKKVESIEKA
jgi:hypothetical protein